MTDRRLEAIAGPLHYDHEGPLVPSAAIPSTPDVALTCMVVATTTALSVGRYVVNSPIVDGRRAYVYVTLGGDWRWGLPARSGAAMVEGVPQVVKADLGRGLPAGSVQASVSMTGVYGTVHRLAIWPRTLTPYEETAVRHWLAARYGTPLT